MPKFRTVILTAALTALLGAAAIFLKQNREKIESLQSQRTELIQSQKDVQTQYQKTRQTKDAASKLLRLEQKQKTLSKDLDKSKEEQEEVAALEEAISVQEDELARDFDELDQYWKKNFQNFAEQVVKVKQLILNLQRLISTGAPPNKISAKAYLIESEIEEAKNSCSILSNQALLSVERISKITIDLRERGNRIAALKNPNLAGLQSRVRQFLEASNDVLEENSKIPLQLEGIEQEFNRLEAQLRRIYPD